MGSAKSWSGGGRRSSDPLAAPSETDTSSKPAEQKSETTEGVSASEKAEVNDTLAGADASKKAKKKATRLGGGDDTFGDGALG